MGLATGFGPTLGIPFGRTLTLQVTLLPVMIPDQGGGGSYGVRLQEFLGRNPRARLYLVEGGSASGWDDTWLWGWDPTPGIVSVAAEPDGRRHDRTRALRRSDRRGRRTRRT